MSEVENNQVEAAKPETPAATPDQDGTDWKAEARKWEQRAKENKAVAERLAEFEDAQKTEQERLTERLQTAEQAAQQAKAEAARYRIASRHGITEEDAQLFLTGTDEDTLVRQAEAFAARVSKPSTPRPDPAAGVRGASGELSNADRFADLVDGLF